MYEVGTEIEAWCGQCKVYRASAVTALNPDGSVDRVQCLYCNTSRNYRPRADDEETADRSPVDRTDATVVAAIEEDRLTSLIRALLREELELTTAKIGDKWIGGKLILRPGKPGLQEKEIPIEAFFHKIVMARDRLRVLEQQINLNDKLTDAEKIQMQQYITRCYGTLTTFNILFKDQKDHFVGQKTT